MKDKSLPEKTVRICAVVVTYNRKVLLEECLTALLNQTRHLDEIIVIDNDSTDGTKELMKAKFSGATYVKLPENVGGAGGFHEGMKQAYEKGYDWIWVMDDDAIPMSDALEKLMISSAISQDRVYALASAVVNQDGSVCLFHRRMFNSRLVMEKTISEKKYRQAYFEIDTSSFVGFLVSRKAVREVGLPIKEFFIYYDDTEYSLRIRRRGMIVVVPGSKILHDERRDAHKKFSQWQKPFDWRDYYGIRNRIYTYRKYSSNGLSFFTRVSVISLNLIALILLFKRSKRQSMKILISCIKDGLKGKLGKNSQLLPRQTS